MGTPPCSGAAAGRRSPHVSLTGNGGSARFSDLRDGYWGNPFGMYMLWMVAKSVSHHLETMGNHGWLVVTGESAFQDVLGGAGFRPSTVRVRKTSKIAGLPVSFLFLFPLKPNWPKRNWAALRSPAEGD